MNEDLRNKAIKRRRKNRVRGVPGAGGVLEGRQKRFRSRRAWARRGSPRRAISSAIGRRSAHERGEQGRCLDAAAEQPSLPQRRRESEREGKWDSFGYWRNDLDRRCGRGGPCFTFAIRAVLPPSYFGPINLGRMSDEKLGFGFYSDRILYCWDPIDPINSYLMIRIPQSPNDLPK